MAVDAISIAMHLRSDGEHVSTDAPLVVAQSKAKILRIRYAIAHAHPPHEERGGERARSVTRTERAAGATPRLRVQPQGRPKRLRSSLW